MNRTWVRGLLVAFSVALSVSLINLSGILDHFEWQTYDWRMQILREDSQLPQDISVILVDDASLKALDHIAGRWPWPRSIHADLIEFLSYANPKAVLFDIDFWEKQLVLGTQGSFLSPHDQRLVEATTEYPFVYHAISFASENHELHKVVPLPQDFSERFAMESKYQLINFQDRPNNTFQIPYTDLYRAAIGMGTVNMFPDEDGVYRRTRLWHQFQRNRFPSLGFAPILARAPHRQIERKNTTLSIAETEIPLDEDDRYIINYYHDYPGYSYSGILSSLQAIRSGDFEKIIISPEEFLDKIVYVGVSAAGLNDLKNSPMNPNLPGVYIHATIAGNILAKDFISMLPQWINYFAISFLAGITVFGVLYVPRIYAQVGIPVASFGVYFCVAFLGQKLGYIIPVVAPGASTFFALTATLALLLLTEGREKRKIKRMMSQYLSPAVLDTVVNNPAEFLRAEVGANEKLTILFSDIRGFTSMSEVLPAERVVEILNYYFSEMTEIIFRNEGTIDKFIGDAIMSFWGAPIRTTDHADRAVLAATQMLARLNNVNAWLSERQYPNLEIGIGLNTGNVVLGNIGSEHKLEYTIIGDNVNLASRMEGLTKQYGCGLLISESTYNALTQPIPCRLIDLVRVKGKKQPIRIYQPLQTEQAQPEILKRNEEFFNCYLARRWKEALEVLAELPEDTFRRQMSERCRYFQKTPPDATWDGVYTLTSK